MTEYGFADPTTGERLSNPFDDHYAFTTDPGEVARRVENAGRTWAELEAAADLLERHERTLVAALSRRARGVLKTDTAARQYATTDEKVVDIGMQVEEARKAARIAKVHYETMQVWSRLIQTKWSTDRELAKIR